MNTFLLQLNDTIAMSDSTVVELAKALNACQPCLQEAETNCNDVTIVAIICAAIVLVALIAKWAIWSWQKAVITSKREERLAKEQNDKEVYARKQEANKVNREWQLADEARKRQYLLEDEARKSAYDKGK